jgi:hypothetical protein
MEDNTANSESPTLMQHAIKFGAIMGAVGFVLTLLLYAVDYTLLADWKIGLLILAVFIGFVIYAGINYRGQIGGFINYGKAFQHAFIALAIAGLIGVLGNMLLYTVIDPELPTKLADAAVEKTAAMLESFGTPEEAIDEAVEKMKDEMPSKFGPVGLLTGYLWALIFYAVIAAISGLVVRKNQPEVM